MSAPDDISLENVHRFALPDLAGTVDKAARGQVLVVGGSSLVPGAVLLTGLAALRAGAGRLQLAANAATAVALGVAAPEAAVLTVKASAEGEPSPQAVASLASRLKTTDAVVVGPGMMESGGAGELALRMMASPSAAAFLLDAAAMTGVDYRDGRVKALAGRLVITPHAGEMAKLAGVDRQTVEADPLGMARQMSRASGAVVVMKGADTFIVSPDGRAWRHRDGVVGLATSGSGDVLAGVIGGLLARGASPLVASVWGVCVHAGAGARLAERIGPLGFLARELLDEIPRVLAATSG